MRLSDKTLDAATFAFALWTIACNATAMAGGTGRMLVTVAAVVFALAACVVWGPRRRPRPIVEAAAEGASAEARPEPVPSAYLRVVSALGLMCALGVLALWEQTRSGPWVWGASCVFFIGATIVLLLRRPLGAPAVTPAVPTAREEALLWVLAAIGAASTLLLHLFNTDDVVYVNIGVALADHPEYELFSRDTIHDAGMLLMPVYAVHSFELLGGALSLLTRIPTLLVIHLGLATLAGLLTPLAWARLFRLLDPGRWLWMVAIVTSMYLFDGSDTRSFAMHGFVRLFQGKAILLTVGVPLITANAIVFAHAPSLRGLLALAAAVISGVGLSSTGLWLAPMVAGTALLVALAPRLSSLVILALGVLPCLYPVALGLWVRGVMAARRAAAAVVNSDVATNVATEATSALTGRSFTRGFVQIGQAMSVTFGGRDVAAAYMACLLLAWPLARTELAKRYILLFCSIGTVFLLNPLLIKFLQTNVTGNGTYSRVLWYLPVTAAFAICFSSMIPSDGTRRGRLAAAALSCAALIGFYIVVPRKTVLSAGHAEVSLRPKVDRDAYPLARHLIGLLPPGSRVLAPRVVGMHLPMLQHHPYPVITKAPLVKRDPGQRFALRKVADNDPTPMKGKRRAWFTAGLNRYQVNAVVLSPQATAKGLDATLAGAGFSLVSTFEGNRVWTRPQRPARGSP